MKTYKNLDAWNVAVDLNYAVLSKVQRLHDADRVNYGKQISKTVFGIPSAIAEGFTYSNYDRSLEAYHNCLSHLAELETELTIMHRLSVLHYSDGIRSHIIRVRKLVYGLIRGAEKRHLMKSA